MTNKTLDDIISIIEKADYGNPAVNGYIKTMGISNAIAKVLIEKGVVINTSKNNTQRESGTSSAEQTNTSKVYNTQAEQKNILFEIAEDTMPKVFENEIYLSEFLDLMSRFPNFTSTNLFLVSAQQPQAKLLKSFEEWKSEGYSIKKGQKGIKVFHFEGKKTDKNGKSYNDFSIKTLFDISQTDCETTIIAPTYDNKLLFSALIKGTSTPIKPVEREELPANHSAFFDNKQNVILIAKDLPFCVQFNSLCCELMLSEICSRDKKYTRSRYESNCICASYIVSKKFGVDSSYLDLSDVCSNLRENNNVDVRKTIEYIKSDANALIERVATYIERTLGKEVVR